MNDILKVCEVELTYRSKVKASQRPQVTTSREAYDLLLSVYDKGTMELKEYFKVVLLNRAQKVLGVHHLSNGGIDGTCVDIRNIMQLALLGNASRILISHNHPGGNTKPSANDRETTARIKQACEIMKINLVDHLIVTGDIYYSFADEGEL